MKKILLFLLCIPFISFAQEQTKFTILEHTANYDLIKAEIGSVVLTDVSTPNGVQKIVSLQKGAQLLEAGAPDLPMLAVSLVVPNQKDGEVEIVSSDYFEVENIDVAPSKGKFDRQQKPSDIPYTFGSIYSQNVFYPRAKNVSLYKPFILRDLRGQTAHIFPVQYNAVSKTLRVFKEIIFKVHYTKPATENILIADNEFPTEINHEFDEIYNYQFLNYKTLAGAYSPLPQHGKMLIFCDADYASAMPDFIEWKERKGYEVFFEVTDTITGGPTEANLLTRATQYYNQHQITYLLIVGDATDIPPQNSYYTIPGLWGPSDLAYAYQSGNDHYPEYIVGRFSCDTLQDALTQVKRTLDYERSKNTASVWMRRQVAIGSQQGPGDKGQYDHVHLRTIADSNKNYGPYVYNYEMYDGSHGGNDAVGDPPVNSLGDAINSGVGLINYCGHGGTDIFSTSTFIGASQMPNLTNNNGEWPFIFSTACLVGNFVYSTCLGEQFLRASDGAGNPKGAVATLMSSILQSWDPPMHGQDEMNGILTHNRPGTYQTTFGAITTSGIMSTNDYYNTGLDSNGGNEIADTWILFGDPSVELFTEDKGTLTCTHSATIGKHSTSFKVHCSENETLIGLYYQNDFLASAVVKNGVAEFTFPAVLVLDTIDVTATKQNFQPYYGIVEVTNETPFSINDLEKFNIQVFPNPTTDIIIIQDRDKHVKSAELFDFNGRKIIVSSDKNISLKNLPSGLYQLYLHTDAKVLSVKITKR